MKKCLRVLSILLAVMMVFSTMPLMTFAAEGEITVWNGSVTVPAKGDGSAANPYQISNGAELAWVARLSQEDSAGKYFLITKDIYLNSPASSAITYDANGYVNQYSLRCWPSGGVSSYALDAFGVFAGNIDGMGHTIFGMNNGWAPNGFWGLFSSLAGGAVVKGINIDSAYYKRSNGGSWSSSNSYASGIAGSVVGSNVTIEGCTVYKSTFQDHAGGWANAGGIIGISSGNTNINITNCGTDILFKNIRASYIAAGILGDNWGSLGGIKVANCWSNNYPVDNSNGITRSTFTNCYTLAEKPAEVTAEAPEGLTIVAGPVKGEEAKTTMPDFDWERDWQTVEGANPIPRYEEYEEPEVPEADIAARPIDPNAPVWNGSVATGFAGGDGTEGNPYQITNGSELAYLVRLSADDTTGKHYKIMNDIHMSAPSYTYDANGYVEKYSKQCWPQGGASAYSLAAFGVFAGTLDGQGYTIAGLNNSWAPEGNWGLFGTLGGGATVKNINIDSAYYKRSNGGAWGNSNTWAAGIAGQTSGGMVTIENCTVYRSTFEEHAAGWANLAGILGRNPGLGGTKITDCGADVKMTTTYYLGGIIADGWTYPVAISNCWSNVYPAGNDNTNGAAGATYTNCYTLGDATAKVTTAIPDGLTKVEGSVKGDDAKTTMPNLGWVHKWLTVADSNPMPRTVETACDGEWVVDAKATSAAAGSMSKTCSICGKTETKEIAQIPDLSNYNGEYTLDVNTAGDVIVGGEAVVIVPTGSEVTIVAADGYAITSEAIDGGVKYTSTLAHVCEFGGWIVETKATSAAEGSMYRECLCGEKETKAIAQIPDLSNTTADYTLDANTAGEVLFGGNGTLTVLDGSDVTVVVADGFKLFSTAVEGGVAYTCAALPNADVETLDSITLKAGEYFVWNGSVSDGEKDLTLDAVMKFSANDTLEECENGAFKNWLCDFNIKFTGLENGTIIADNCYLVGNYGSFGWIAIPTDGIVIEEGIAYPVVAGYDATLNYKDICGSVKEFTAAIYVDPAIAEANPDMKIELSLVMTNNEDASDTLTIGEPAVFDVEDLKAVAENTTTGAKFATLSAAMKVSKAGETVKLLKDIDDTASAATRVTGDVVLDLNGHYIKATNFLSTGDVIDTSDELGGVVISNDTSVAFTLFQPDNAQLPLYDAENGCYRFFQYEVKTMMKKVDGQSLQFGFKLLFNNDLAYSLIESVPEDLTLKINIDVVDGDKSKTLTYECNSEILAEYASVAAGNTSKLMILTVYGTSTLHEGATVTATPTLTSVTTVTKNGNTKTFTK